jgi:hypothetical protein
VSLVLPPGSAAVRGGRPDFEDIFSRVLEYAKRMGEGKGCRVAVSVCGPEEMVNSATRACREASGASRGEVVFDLHVEIFNV